MEVTIDTSAIMAVLLGEATRARVIDATRDVELLSAPTLPWEVGNSLSALFKRRRIDVNQATAAVRSYASIPVRLPRVNLEASVALADEHGIYAYDAYMLECARRYRTPFLSLDRAQCAVARSMGVELVEVHP